MSVSEDYWRAGAIAAHVRDAVRNWLQPGRTYLDLCAFVENSIRGRGCEPAFPCNISVNQVAAHYTAEPDDAHVIQDGDLVKVDIGAHLRGHIADTAVSVSFHPRTDDLVQTAEAALSEALRVARGGIRAGDVGRAINDFCERRGYRPIANLSGHLIEPYRIHAGESIPNVWVPGTPSLKEGKVYAIEPFVTMHDGVGLVVEGATRNIFGLVARKRTGQPRLDHLVQVIWDRYRTLPFAARFLLDTGWPVGEVQSALQELAARRLLHAYAVLVEQNGAPVAQAEHTVLMTKRGAEIITRGG